MLGTQAQAQTAPAGAPDAGSILQQLQPVKPALPSSSQPALQITPVDAGTLPQSLPFTVKTIRITGNTIFSTEELHALIAAQEGSKLTLAQLEELAARITSYYQDRGYPLSRAIIPAQTIKDGVIIIQVVEARYGKVQLNNSSTVDSSLLGKGLTTLESGRAIASTELDSTLLLLSDVPGVRVNAVLKPGAEVGTSDLDVIAVPGAAWAANLALDNYGNRYIGRTRLGGGFNIFNPFGRGDIISANYKLGDTARALDAHGTAGVSSVWLRQPLLRSRQANVYAQLQYDAKQLRDRIDVTDTRTDRRLDNLVLGVNGDVRDKLLGGGINIWNIGWTNGHVTFKDENARALDAVSARTSGSFSKWNVNFSRIQALAAKDSLYLNFAAQVASSNLDSAEKMSVGGPYSVRAYDIGVLSADTGYFGSIEWRHDLGQFAAGRLQASAFVDSAHVKINQRPWGTADNSVTLSGTGLGLTWEGADLWRVTASLATRLGDRPASVGQQSSTHGWITVNKAF